MNKKIIIGVVIIIALGIIFFGRSAMKDKEAVVSTDTSMKVPTAGKTPQPMSQADAQATLVSRVWVWQKTVMSDGKVITPAKAGAFSATFTDTKVTGTTDCNNFFGSVLLVGGKITISEIGATEKYCAGSEEGTFWAMLNKVDGYIFDKDKNLVLNLEMDSGSVYFKMK